MWPFNRKTETRESEGYEALLLNSFVAGAEGNGVSAATGALESCAGIYGRAFASATVSPSVCRTGLTPSVLGQIGHELCRTGEIVFRIDVRGGKVELQQSGFHDTYGGPRPADWKYRVSTYGPGGTATYYLPRQAVAHCQYFQEPLRPWVGLSPLQFAAYTGGLSAHLERSMSREAGTPTGMIIPVPESATLSDSVKRAVTGLAGALAFPKSFAGGLGDKASAPGDDWKPRRLGPQYTAPEVAALQLVCGMVASACGVPPTLISAQGDSASAREAYRQLLHSTIRPVAHIVEGQLSEALGVEVVLNFDELQAADIASKARAWRALVGKEAKMPDTDARRLVGFE